ncbi:MAG: SHOCT domain-containing protein [Gammaproteobacteria bacterium]|nr:SHOCT domain-containing protein [Gammaproteobacteria bacterium]
MKGSISYAHKMSDYGCVYTISLLDYYLKEYKCIKLGRIDKVGKVLFYVNSNNAQCAFIIKKGIIPSFNGIYSLEDFNIEIKKDEEIIFETQPGLMPIVNGEFLSSNDKSSNQEKNKYIMIVTTNDVEFTGFKLKIEDENIIKDFINTVNIILKSRYSVKKNIKIGQRVEDDPYGMLIKLKDLYDKKIISEEEYKDKREKYLSKI